MKKQVFKALMLCALIFAFSSCTQRLIDFTVISSKNVSLKIDKAQGKAVTGTKMGFLGIGANIKDAMDKALQSAGPDYDLLMDGVVRVKAYPFVSGYQVEGTAVSTSSMKASLGDKGFEEWCNAHNIFDPSSATVQN